MNSTVLNSTHLINSTEMSPSYLQLPPGLLDIKQAYIVSDGQSPRHIDAEHIFTMSKKALSSPIKCVTLW
ncbi:unnamed protein product [Arctogadus glacialis]